MIRILIYVLMLGIGVSTTSHASSQCIEPTTITAVIDAKIGAKVVAQACRISIGKYRITLRVISRNKLLQTVKVEGEGEAYHLSIDTSVDINLDGVSDLGVATGKGRAGDGMHYWVVAAKPARLLDLGEAPRLTRPTSEQKLLFALIPSGGEIQSTRVEYEFTNSALVPTRAIQFRPGTDGTYEITVLDCIPGEALAWRLTSTQRISEEQAQACMSGAPCP